MDGLPRPRGARVTQRRRGGTGDGAGLVLGNERIDPWQARAAVSNQLRAKGPFKHLTLLSPA